MLRLKRVGAKAAIQENPEATVTEIAKAANVSRATAGEKALD
jgi:hypothetical protein